MVEVVEQSSGKVLALRLNGKLLHSDYQKFIPLMESIIKDHGSIRCLIEMTDFAGIELRALWDDLKFDVKHSKSIERCAIVGDKKWEEWMTKLSRPLFPHAELKYFDRSDAQQASAWIREGV